ncbi:MAG: hypothetical protein PHY34_01975 [Patescibacteria group bacterium]|nr:hypothetical protein [Patescibacteria group bacterium]MDD5715297.1 hypothetical protein [Patescibacteria group bacterium]
MIPVAVAAGTVNAAAGTASFMQNIDWTRPTWDLFIVLFFVIAAFLYGLSLGRDRIIVILVSIYMSLAIVEHAPIVNNAGFQHMINNAVGQFFVFQISAFLLLFVILFFVITRSALLKTIASSDTPGPWWQVLLYSILHVGLLVSVILSYIPRESLDGVLAPLTLRIFTTDFAQNVWIIGPAVAMFIFKGGAGQKKKRQYIEEEP